MRIVDQMQRSVWTEEKRAYGRFRYARQHNNRLQVGGNELLERVADIKDQFVGGENARAEP